MFEILGQTLKEQWIFSFEKSLSKHLSQTEKDRNRIQFHLSVFFHALIEFQY